MIYNNKKIAHLGGLFALKNIMNDHLKIYDIKQRLH